MKSHVIYTEEGLGIRLLIVNFVHFMAKHYRHQDTKAQKGLLTNNVSSWLCAFVATFPACPG